MNHLKHNHALGTTSVLSPGRLHTSIRYGTKEWQARCHAPAVPAPTPTPTLPSICTCTTPPCPAEASPQACTPGLHPSCTHTHLAQQLAGRS